MAFNLFDFSKIQQSAQPTSRPQKYTPQVQPQPTGKMSVQEFAGKIKSKYPAYQSMDDSELATKIIAKYPVYKDQVEFKQTPTFSGNFAGGFLENIPKDLTSIATSFARASSNTPIVKPIGEAINSVGNIVKAGGKLVGSGTVENLGKAISKGSRFVEGASDAADNMASDLGKKIVAPMIDAGSYDPESTGAKAGRIGSAAATLLVPSGGIAKEAGVLRAGAKKGLISKPKDAIAGLTKDEKTALQTLIPKDFTPSKIEDLKVAGKLDTGKGLLGSKNIYKPGADDIEIARDAAPHIKPSASSSENIQYIRQGIEKEANALESAIAQNNPIIPKNKINAYIKTTTDAVMDNPEMVGDNRKIAENLIRKFQAIQNEEGGSALGILKARKRFDAYINSVKPKALGSTTGGVYDSTVRAIRNGANDLLDGLIKDVNVKASLKRQSNLYKAIDMLAPQKDLNKLGRFVRNPVVQKVAGYTTGGGLGISVAGYLGGK